jgi:ABC-2 type transport system permease protein
VVPALLRKEWLTIRSNTGQLMGLLTPLIFVVILSRGMFARHPAYLLPGAVGYAMLAPLAAVYNIFGPEGPGVQMYLLAPVRMRDVVLAKNLASLALLSAEGALAWGIAVSMSAVRIPAVTQIGALLWVVFVLAVNLALGTLRSIQSPRKFMPGQTRQMRSAPTSRTSGLLVLAVVMGSLLLQLPVTRLARHLHAPWLAVGIFGVLAGVGLAAYALMLRNVDALVLRNRDVIEQELCGVS